ncbi:MAG TPA: heavy-metal-associated domain-containing protein [Thermoleophilia bacterium]|nr:heavy-metal-associated domain-containing protein [Thermoleophilia bacterium]
MDEVVVKLPDLWADHHVLRVREALAGAPGVAAVVASAKDHEARVTFDPAATAPDAVVATLAAAGYEAGELAADEARKDKPAWATAPRVTGTDAADLAMSGDYRKY